jgi:hypothetical protein
LFLKSITMDLRNQRIWCATGRGFHVSDVEQGLNIQVKMRKSKEKLSALWKPKALTYKEYKCWGSYGGNHSGRGLLGCAPCRIYAVSEQHPVSVFRVDPEDGGSVFLQNVGIPLQGYTVSQYQNTTCDIKGHAFYLCQLLRSNTSLSWKDELRGGGGILQWFILPMRTWQDRDLEANVTKKLTD